MSTFEAPACSLPLSAANPGRNEAPIRRMARNGEIIMIISLDSGFRVPPVCTRETSLLSVVPSLFSRSSSESPAGTPD